MNPKISILVPIYNVERYLKQCLDSILNQTFKDFEVICINDGSTDNSLNIIKEFMALDSRFKLIDKENTGYGHSMNLGIAQCQGKYIGIVESDDFIEPEMFEILYNIAEDNNLDIARCNYHQFTQNSKNKMDLSFISHNKVIKPLEHASIFYQAPSIWANLYRKDFILSNNINFLETPGASYQDVSFSFKVYALCQRFMFIDKPLLNYRIDSVNSSINSKEKVFCVCVEYEEILRFTKSNGEIYKVLRYHIPILRFNCYWWNLLRIHKQFRWVFLQQWRKEIKQDKKENRIDKKLFGTKRYIKMLKILYIPIIYLFI